MEFIQTEVEVKLYGHEIKMRLPTYRESLAYKKSVESCKEDEEKLFECVLSQLETLGLPKNLGEKLETDHLLKLFSMLMEKKS